MHAASRGNDLSETALKVELIPELVRIIFLKVPLISVTLDCNLSVLKCYTRNFCSTLNKQVNQGTPF